MSIVIVGHNLATVVGQGQLEATIGVTCPKCDHEHEIESKFSMPPISATTFPYAQKVFPFCRTFGVGTFGSGLIEGKSVYFAMRLFEKKLEKEVDNDIPLVGVTEVAPNDR